MYFRFIKSRFIRSNEGKVTLITGAFTILLVAFFFIRSHQVFAANFADDVLRPLIGGKATITIEAAFFKIQDTFNHFTYYFYSPIIKPFNSRVTGDKSKKIVVDKTFILTPIPTPSFFPSLSGEGIWVPIDTQTKETVMAKSFIRPDPERGYAVVALVKMDMSHLMLSAVAGIKEPGGSAKRGPGAIPQEIQASNRLIAAFNGGFQLKDGHYGMLVGKEEYLPLQKNLATLVMSDNDKPKIVNYVGQALGNNVTAIRQNCPLLIQNSHIVTSSTAWNMQTWGLTTTNSMYTWRSGLGVTKNGDLIFAVGPSLVPETLAKALYEAGAVDAMQLDINPVWVRFVTFHTLGNSKYTYEPLVTNMINGGYQYLRGYNKDFFYVTKKN